MLDWCTSSYTDIYFSVFIFIYWSLTLCILIFFSFWHVFICLKIFFTLTNSVVPDEMQYFAAFHLGLHSLQPFKIQSPLSSRLLKKKEILLNLQPSIHLVLTIMISSCVCVDALRLSKPIFQSCQNDFLPVFLG